MPIIRVELDTESFRRLTELAVEERRPIPWQAEMLLLRALAAPVEGSTHGVNPCAEQEVSCAAE
jgi:hypothetical protein